MATITVYGAGQVEVNSNTVCQFEDEFDSRRVVVVLYPERKTIASFPMTKQGRGRAFDVAHDVNLAVRGLAGIVAKPVAPISDKDLWG